MENYQSNPLKIFIQDIFRASHAAQSKYVYQLFNLHFKNIMVHGIVTAMYNNNGCTTNLELTDPTGSIQVYYDSSKSKKNITKKAYKGIADSFSHNMGFGDEHSHILRFLKNICIETKDYPLNFEEGSYVCVVGDIFVDDMKNTRMVSAYECNLSSAQREIIWLEELKYLYDKYYLHRFLT